MHQHDDSLFNIGFCPNVHVILSNRWFSGKWFMLYWLSSTYVPFLSFLWLVLTAQPVKCSDSNSAICQSVLFFKIFFHPFFLEKVPYKKKNWDKANSVTQRNWDLSLTAQRGLDWLILKFLWLDRMVFEWTVDLTLLLLLAPSLVYSVFSKKNVMDFTLVSLINNVADSIS